MERCGQPAQRLDERAVSHPMSRTMLTALGLAAPDLYEFFLRNFVDPAGPQSRDAFIRNVRSAAARCSCGQACEPQPHGGRPSRFAPYP